MNETTLERAESAAGAEESCYHCGLPIPPQTHFTVVIDGRARRMCCAGCAAVAQAIVDNGLSDYYRHRDAMPEPVREALPEVVRELESFDLPELTEQVSRPVGEHEREVTLILEGITCAACVWLNEQHLRRQPGVTHVEINYATRRALVRWDPERTSLSRILKAIAEIGYRAHPFDPKKAEEVAQRERRSMLWRVFVAGFASMQVMMYAIPTYLAGEGDMPADIERLLHWASLVLTLPAVFYSCGPFFANAWRDLKLRRIGMDVPVALGIGVAFLASLWATVSGQGEVYFDSVSMFAFFLLGGRFLEMLARQRAVRGLEEVARVIPAVTERLESGTWERVPVARLAPGDRIRVRPGQTIPVDGRVGLGHSEVSEAILTGESRPIPKAEGDLVLGGSLNGGGVLEVVVERVGEETRLATIRRAMERAQSEKPALASLADRYASRFIIAVLGLAVITIGLWAWIDSSRIVPIVVSVLVVACPCALSLATPVALTAATDALMRSGVLVTRDHALETLARLTDIAFDKTGTLTRGQLTVVEVLPAPGRDARQAQTLAAALEAASEHPIARAFTGTAPANVPVAAFEAITGQGLSARVAGKRTCIGRPEWVASTLGLSLEAMPRASDDRALTRVALGDETGWIAVFGLSDVLREEAPELLHELHGLGLRTHLLSGDAPEIAETVARTLAIDEVRAGLTPEGKIDALRQVMAQPGRVVAMVGDGVNDAPVLAGAHVSVAMGGGADLARLNADVVLLGDDLSGIARAIRHARRTLAIVAQNHRWAFAYNLLAIPFAMAGWVTPWMAGLGMAASSLGVVLNALRLQRAR